MATGWSTAARAEATTRGQTYEQYAVTTAIDLVREIIRLIEVGPAEGQEQEQLKRFNINRAYAAIDDLRRIEL